MPRISGFSRQRHPKDPMTVDPLVIATVAMAITSAALAVTTVHYAQSTSAIAKATADAAQAARDTAEIALLQNVLTVQPRLFSTAPLTVDYVPSDVLLEGTPKRQRVPIEVSIELRNLGVGLAINTKARVIVFGIEFPGQLGTSAGLTIPPNGNVALANAVSQDGRRRVALAVLKPWSSTEVGLLEVSCEDALGSTIATTWVILSREDGTLVLGQREVRYTLPDRGPDLPHASLLSRWQRLLATHGDA